MIIFHKNQKVIFFVFSKDEEMLKVQFQNQKVNYFT